MMIGRNIEQKTNTLYHDTFVLALKLLPGFVDI